MLLTRAILSLAIALCVATQAADAAASKALCETMCSYESTKCRKTPQLSLAKCTELHGCDKSYCQGNYECKFGCATCKRYWQYHLIECDRKLSVCMAKCPSA